MVMAESTILEDIEIGKIERQSRYFKAKLLEDHQEDGADEVFKNAIANEEVIVLRNKELLTLI